MRTFLKCEVQLDRDEWFDIRAEVEGSNQRAKAGWFRMEVRAVEGWTYGDGRLADRLYAIGRRYKPDGTLSTRVASARVVASRLPEEVLRAMDQMTSHLRSQDPRGGRT